MNSTGSFINGFLVLMVILGFSLAGELAVCRSDENPQVLADRILVVKSKRIMRLFADDRVIREYRVALGKNPIGPKRSRDDGRTPEGDYRIDYRNPESRFHRSLHISYPGSGDIEAARIGDYDPGGDIMIHGIRNGFGWLGFLHRMMDWTDGCVAVTNDEMDEIWDLVPVGTPIRIVP